MMFEMISQAWNEEYARWYTLYPNIHHFGIYRLDDDEKGQLVEQLPGGQAGLYERFYKLRDEACARAVVNALCRPEED